MNIYHIPDLADAIQRWQAGKAGGPGHYMALRAKYLLEAGHCFVSSASAADLILGHGVVQTGEQIDVLHIAAVWPTAYLPGHPAWWLDHNEIMRQAMQRAGLVVVHSEFTAGLCRGLAGVEPVIVPQAWDPEEWEGIEPGDWRRDWGIGDRPLALWAKTTADLLRDPLPAVAVARRLPETVVALTAERRVVEGLAGEPLPENVICTGRLPYLTYQTLLAACDVYLATTLESSGQGQLEAMAMGKPVAGYGWGGVAETVTDGRYGCGELVTPGDLDGLALAVETCLRRAKSYGRRGQGQAAQYAWPEIIGQLVGVYEGAVA